MLSEPPANRIRELLAGAIVVGEGGTRFHLRTLLGEGGQGWVFRANFDDPEGFWVVVKILRPEGVTEDALHRFGQEAKVLQMLGAVPAPNPNIIRFYDHGVHHLQLGADIQLPFIALEYVDGETLAKVIDENLGVGLPIERASRIMKQVARALHTVHEHRIVHRDLKPSNILLAQQHGIEIAKVTDFGLVKAPHLSPRSTATIAGATLGYAPPEQYEMGNSRVGPQTDVFSFGAILFEVLSGRGAFPHQPGESPLRTVARILSGDRPQLARVASTLRPELRERLDIVGLLDREIARATAADPVHRHGSVVELWNAVEPLLRTVERRPSVSAGPAAFAVSGDRAGSVPSMERPRSWQFAVVGRRIEHDRLRTAYVSSEEGAVYAAGLNGVYRFERRQWVPVELPAGLDPRRIRGLNKLRSGELLVYGEAGLAAAVGPGGAARQLPGASGDFNWLGAFTEDGDVILAGERRSRPIGCVAEIGAQSANLHTLTGTTRLFSVTRLASGAILVCGSHGDLVQILPTAQRPVPWGRTGHLYAVARSATGGAYVVGSGGHALDIAPSSTGDLVATLEAVQTTRDLWSLRLDPDGTPWAGGSQGRVLERRSGTWVRIPCDLTQADILAVCPFRGVVTVVPDDGAVIEGRPG
ncbi:MAG: serine/threonine protein kinase [Myxococcales bacterium]|nr:serine/threonine protein kinase [Myxococcales bacterium]